MVNALFSESQFEQMAVSVRRVLSEIGYFVEHDDVRAWAKKAGCTESANGRVLFAPQQIDEIVEALRAQWPARTMADVVHDRHVLRGSIGNLSPKYYDYARGEAVAGDQKNLIELVKFAQMEDRIAALVIPVSRQDVSPAIEPIESVYLMAQYTTKGLCECDPAVPETIPYLGEMAEALGIEPQHFVGRCHCINPPLRLEHRTAETMIQRRRWHTMSMITSMPSIGGSGPVDIAACAVLSAAEIVGGLILSRIIDRDAPLMGYTACNQVDMLTGNGTSSTPQTVRLDAAVVQLMERHFGGGTFVGGRAYVSAKRPGMQAVYERMMKMVGYSQLVDRHGMFTVLTGCLDNGSLISAEQVMLDYEMAEGFDALWTRPTWTDEDVVERLRESVINGGGDFLSSEHTLGHYRDELWAAEYFQCLTATRSEAEILERCHEDVAEKIANYQPASYPAEVVATLGKILARAKAALV